MTRLAVSVEGQTEREFINRVVAPHLSGHGVWAYPVLIGDAGERRAQGGGNVSVDRAISDVAKLCRSHDVVTTFYDYYGFKRGRGRNAEQLEEAILEGVNNRKDGACRGVNVLPHIQPHEFEGLLFTDPRKFNLIPDVDANTLDRLQEIRDRFPTPEDIDDGQKTAPSKRVKKLIPRYDKTLYGPLIAEDIGLDAIRSACPRFAKWLDTLEALGTP